MSLGHLSFPGAGRGCGAVGGSGSSGRRCPAGAGGQWATAAARPCQCLDLKGLPPSDAFLWLRRESVREGRLHCFTPSATAVKMGGFCWVFSFLRQRLALSPRLECSGVSTWLIFKLFAATGSHVVAQSGLELPGPSNLPVLAS